MLRAAFRSKVKDEEAEKFNNTESSLRTQGEFGDEFEDAKENLSMAFHKDAGLEDSSVSLMNHTESKMSAQEGKTDEELGEIKSPSKHAKTPCTQESMDQKDDKDFPYTERDIYEMQLVQLQEQLVAAMIQAQEKSEELEKLSGFDPEKLTKELELERKKNIDLEDKIKILKQKNNNNKLLRKNASRVDPRSRGANRNSGNYDEGNGGEDWVDLGHEIGDKDGAHEPDTPTTPITDGPSSSGRSSSTESGTATDQLPLIDNLDGTSTAVKLPKHSRAEEFKKRMLELIVDRLWDFVNDEPESTSDQDDDGDPLAVKTLKENINRFTNGIRPITNFVKGVNRLVSWSNSAASFIGFMLYMYAARHGYLLSLILLLCIGKLFMNYLHARGIATQLGFRKKEKEEAPSEDKSWSDKFQLVLQVARKVQNLLGKMADSLEKIKNLLMWQHPATKKLFTNLCIAFVASIILDGTTLFMFIALFFGIKMFIIGPTYKRFPKVKIRYDNIARIWPELPTDAILVARETIAKDRTLSRDQNNSSITSRTSTISDVTSAPTTSSQNSAHSASQQHFSNLCERLKIPITESPLPSWEDGRRCTLMNKDKPLTNMKHGKLFLTQSYLCFERARSGSSKNVALKMENITRLAKFKPIGIMPGTGMAIEVEARGVDKPYIFGALLGRDEVYDSIMCTAKAADLPWAT